MNLRWAHQVPTTQGVVHPHLNPTYERPKEDTLRCLKLACTLSSHDFSITSPPWKNSHEREYPTIFTTGNGPFLKLSPLHGNCGFFYFKNVRCSESAFTQCIIRFGHQIKTKEVLRFSLIFSEKCSTLKSKTRNHTDFHNKKKKEFKTTSPKPCNTWDIQANPLLIFCLPHFIKQKLGELTLLFQYNSIYIIITCHLDGQVSPSPIEK